MEMKISYIAKLYCNIVYNSKSKSVYK